MTLFLGTVAAKIDPKGRVSVPSDFRAAVSSDFQGVVLYHSFTQNCIEGCDYSRMEKIADASDNLDLFSEEAQNINSLIFSDARQLAFDVAGRIVVPADLLKFAGIAGEALFVGKGKTFQIWEKAAYEVSLAAAREKAVSQRPALSFVR